MRLFRRRAVPGQQVLSPREGSGTKPSRRWGLAVCVLLSMLGGAAWGQSAEQIKARQEQARKQQAELQSAIRGLHKQIESTEASRKEVVNELQASEKAISETGRRLAELGEQQQKLDKEITALQRKAAEHKKTLAGRQAELSRQLQAQYANGLSPWAALLSGNDPQEISRELGYLSYVSQAQADAIRGVKQTLSDLAEAETSLHARQQEQAKVLADLAQQKKEQEKHHNERERVLIKIGAELRTQRNESDALKRDDQRLGKLVQGLEATLARQAEQARQAELARQAAERRRQEQARQEQARQEQARREAEAQAARERAEQEARAAREQVERSRVPPPPAPEPVAPTPAEPIPAPEPEREPPPRPERIREAEPQPAATEGLRKGLPYPVKGEVQGRFGAERPDGGIWRGIVLRASEGAPVQAVAAGTVVYANWLKGFGNMIIIDHGQQYMSIYAYNQSLLKSVGDSVRAGQSIATVGATGGQVESGLYFEIRHNGAPINPLVWLRR